MSELIIELFDNNHSPRNLHTKPPNINNPRLNISDTDSIQSETNMEDTEIEEDISFHEIFSQHITHPVPFQPNTQELNNSKLKPGIIETLNEENLFTADEQILNPIHAGDILSQNPLTNQISYSQDLTKNLPTENINTEENTNLLMDNPFNSNIGSEDSSESSLISFSQRESGKNTGETKEIDIFQAKGFTSTNDRNSLLQTEKPFKKNLATEGTAIPTENTELNSEKNLNIFQEFNEAFITKSDKKNMVNNQENYYTTAGKDRNLTEIQAPYGELKEAPNIDMKELPWTFKMMAQELSPEDNHNIPISAENGIPKTAERYKETDIPEIQGNISSIQDIPDASEMGWKQDTFEDLTQRRDTYDMISLDTLKQKTSKGTSFTVDTQKTLDNIQLNTANPQISVFSDNKLMSLSNINNNSTSYTSYGTSISGMEDAHMNIMEQIFQKIHMVTHGDRSEIKLHLNPPELGSITIHFTEENDEIGAKIFVDNAEVKAAIENNSHLLRESTAVNGIEIHKLEVFVQNDDANKRRSFENLNPDNPQQQSNNQENKKGYYSTEEEDVNDNTKTRIHSKIHNLMIDYII